METRIEELKRYVRFSTGDAERIRAFREVARPHFSRIVSDFYDRIREHEDAHAVLQGEEQIARLQGSLVRWMERLLGGVYDEAYFQETSHIGRVHVRVGLPQRYILAAMALIRVSLCEIAAKEMGNDAALVWSALSRLVDLDLAIMLDAYRDDYAARLEKSLSLEAEAARAEFHYQAAVELVRAMIIAVDSNGRIRLFNREAERVTGFGREEVIGAPFLDVMLAGDANQEHAEAFERVRSGQESLARFHASLTTRSGRIREIRWQLSASDRVPGEELVVFAMGTDVTDEHRALEKARQHEKLAAVGVLAAGLAHEIRNPLNGAQLHIAFLERALRKKGQTDDEMLEAVAVVGDEIKRLAKLVSEFLDFARPKELDRTPVSVGSLVAHVGELVKEQASTANAELKYDLPTTDLVLSVDRNKLEQVLLNLVQNAIEAVEVQGGGQILVRARRQPRSVILDVEDDGPGLPTHGAPVFDAFYSTKPKGTGLGLAIALRIASDHGGTITVDSKPGRTRFSVVLPWESNTEEQ